jgi:hypothetical protein
MTDHKVDELRARDRERKRKVDERRARDRERKRVERAQLGDRGLVRVEVRVPENKADQIRALAEVLLADQPAPK